MDGQFVMASATMLLVNLVYAVVALFVGLVTMRLLDHFMLKKLDLEEEIKKGNIAAAIFAGTLLLFVAIIVSAAVAT